MDYIELLVLKHAKLMETQLTGVRLKHSLSGAL